MKTGTVEITPTDVIIAENTAAMFTCSTADDVQLQWHIKFSGNTLSSSQLDAAESNNTMTKMSWLKIEGTIVEELAQKNYGQHVQLIIVCTQVMIMGTNTTSVLSIQGTI